MAAEDETLRQQIIDAACDLTAKGHKNKGENDNGENKIGNGPGSDHSSASAQGFIMEEFSLFFRADRFFVMIRRAGYTVIIDKFYIAPERYPGKFPSGPLFIIKAPDFLAKTD